MKFLNYTWHTKYFTSGLPHLNRLQVNLELLCSYGALKDTLNISLWFTSWLNLFEI